MTIIMDAIKSIRNLRAEMNVIPSRKAKTIIITEDNNIKSALEEGKVYLKNLPLLLKLP